MSERYEVRQSRPKAILGVAGCIAFVALGWWIKDLPGDKAHYGGWASVIFFGLMCPLWLTAVINPARLVADAAGVAYTSTFRSKRWAWSEIAEVIIYRHRGAVIVQLALTDAGNPLRALPGAGPKTSSLSTAWTVSPESLAARLTDMKQRFDSQAPSRPANTIVM